MKINIHLPFRRIGSDGHGYTGLDGWINNPHPGIQCYYPLSVGQQGIDIELTQLRMLRYQIAQAYKTFRDAFDIRGGTITVSLQ